MDLSLKDQAYIWHPFTQMHKAFLIPIVKAQGIYLYDQEGKSYIDAISSWWVNLHGHCHPHIAQAISRQTAILEHVLFAGFTHQPAVDLATRLLTHLPKNLSKIFYSDNGSTSVEIAIKMSLQYFYNQHIPKKEVVCFKKSYHGDTFGAMSSSGKNEIHRPFWSHLFDVKSIDPPLSGFEERSFYQLEEILKEGKTACFIFEPLILGTGGMIIYPSHGLDRLIEICRKYDVLTIGDEVMTGFGRTGTFFACDRLENPPDFICLSKGLTGGFLPLGVTACTINIFNAFLGDHLSQAFLHGHSYTANPLSCTSALASLDLLERHYCVLQREKIAASHIAFCQKHSTKFKRCESLGTILAIELHVENPSYFNAVPSLYKAFLDQGIVLRPLGNVIYLMPPYCIEEVELQFIYHSILTTLGKL